MAKRQHYVTTPILLAGLAIAAAVLACSLFQQPDDPFEPAPTGVVLASPTRPPGGMPSPTTVPLPQAQIGFFEVLYLSYDPGVWSARPFLDSEGRPVQSAHGQTIEVLQHQQYQCEIHDNLGHGMGEEVKLNISEKQIGAFRYQVEQWTEVATGNTILVVYQPLETGDDSPARVEMTAQDTNGAACMTDVEQVLLLSESSIRP